MPGLKKIIAVLTFHVSTFKLRVVYDMVTIILN